MTETPLMRRIMVAVTKSPLVRVFRNNVGVGWAGKATVIRRPCTVTVNPGDVVVRNARPLHAGLCEGSSDLIGWTSVEITQEMVGRTVAAFTALEVKTDIGRATGQQSHFVEVVRTAGGIGAIVRSEDEALDAVFARP